MKCHMEYTSEQAKRIEENFVRLKGEKQKKTAVQ